MPQENHGGSQVNHPEKVIGGPLPARDDASEVVVPGEEPFDFPPPPSASQRPAILRARVPLRQMWCDQFDVVCRRGMTVGAIAVVGFVINQPGREPLWKRAASVASTSWVSCGEALARGW